MVADICGHGERAHAQRLNLGYHCRRSLRNIVVHRDTGRVVARERKRDGPAGALPGPGHESYLASEI